MKLQLITICFLFFSINALNSQSIIDTFSYTFDNDLDGWESVSLTTNGEWSWSQNGKADNSPYWNDRDSIESNSLGGAAIYNAAKINGPDQAGVNSSGALMSPLLNFTGEQTVFLRFHQYYRNYGAITKIQYAQDPSPNTIWSEILVNENVNLNVETGISDYQVIDLSDQLGNKDNMKIRFVFDGDYYFWILDDIEFYDAMPFPMSIPEYVADSLRDFGYPYDTESSDWPHVPDELIVQFNQSTPEIEKQAIRDTLNAILVDSCACNRLELWRMGDDIIVGGDTLSGDGGSIGIQERIKKSRASSSIDGVDYNRYNYNEMKDDVFIENLPHPSNILGLDPASDTAKLIAILDTGIELEHDSLSMYIYRNNGEFEEGNEIDDDGNCLVDDWFGWNYVDKNNNPNDDHSHGTHVAGIIQQNMQEFDPSCTYRLIPYKTHDYHGVATLFSVTCATYQAQIDGASVINDSWGFYGDPSEILKNAIDTAKTNEVLIVSAAGNDTTNLSTLPQYPACYPNSNVITVGAYEIGPNGDVLLADFSNYDSICVDILAEGVDFESTVLNDTVGIKSGTSMAAPAVSAAAIMAYCAGHSDYLEVKNNILFCANKEPSLTADVRDGNILNYTFPCLTPIEEIEVETPLEFFAFPNPVSDILYIESFQNIENAQLQIHSLTGQIIYNKKIRTWTSFEKEELNLTGLAPGIYFLTIKQPNLYWTHKLIKI